MSSSPVDPWTGQPEHGAPPGHRPYGGPAGPPPRPYEPDAQPPPPPAYWTGAGPSGPPAPTTPWPAAGHPGNQPVPPGTWPGAAPQPPVAPQPHVAPQQWGTSPRIEDECTHIHARISSGAFPPPRLGQPYDTAPPKRSRLPLILSLGLAGILVLCLGGGGLAYLALSGDDEQAPVASAGPSADVAPSTDPSVAQTPPAATPSAEPSASPRIRLVTPSTLNGRPRSTDPELKTLADQMVREMQSTVTSENGAIGAFYGSAEKENIAMVVGASGFVLDPERELNDAVKGVTSDLSVKRMATVSPGPLGGLAKCGDGDSSGIPLGVCVWADQGSVGMIVLFFSSGADAKSEFVKIRGQVEKRS